MAETTNKILFSDVAFHPIRRQLNAAYAMRDDENAYQALQRLLRELMHLNPSPPRSLEEGLEEILRVYRLGLSGWLWG